jgi:hypothetical protein
LRFPRCEQFQVRFSDDMTGFYIVNPDPFESGAKSNGQQFNGFAEDEEKDEENEDRDDDDEDEDVFATHSTARSITVEQAEPEVEVVAVADAFAKFRRLDQMIDEDEDCFVAKERKPVRKITPPREEPMLLERLQGIIPSLACDKEAASGGQIVKDEKITGVPTMQQNVNVNHQSDGQLPKPSELPRDQPVREPSAVAPSENQRDSKQETEIGGAGSRRESTAVGKPTDGAESERPEPGTIRALRQRWEMMDTGSTEAALNIAPVAATTGSSLSLTGSAGSQPALPPADSTRRQTPPTQSADDTVRDARLSAMADDGPRARSSLPTSLAFTKNRLAKFRLLESRQLERQPVVARHTVRTIFTNVRQIAFRLRSRGPFSQSRACGTLVLTGSRIEP